MLPIPAEGRICAPSGSVPGVQIARPVAGERHALVIFTRFGDEATARVAIPDFAGDLFDPGLPGSLTHFYREMSAGMFTLSGTCLPRWYTARQPASAYLATEGKWGYRGYFGEFVREVLLQVDAEVDFGEFDRDGPDGASNSGDDDGFVDLVFINTLSAPQGFIMGPATGIAGLGLSSSFTTRDPAAGGGYIRIRADSHADGPGGCLQQGQAFTEAVGSMAHEMGHVLGLPDLFDQDVQWDRELAPVKDSAGIGYWGLMGHGARGWYDRGGPTPLCAWSREQLGWIGRNNERLVRVQGNVEDAVFADVNAGGKVYRIPAGDPDEYFLVENRQPGNSFYERHLPAGGLLIWHVDMGAEGNDAEGRKRVDLECADGRFLDAGYPAGREVDAEMGGDNLDFWAHDANYAEAHGGNLGDVTDPFDGVVFTDQGRLWRAREKMKEEFEKQVKEVVRAQRRGKDFTRKVMGALPLLIWQPAPRPFPWAWLGWGTHVAVTALIGLGVLGLLEERRVREEERAGSDAAGLRVHMVSADERLRLQDRLRWREESRSIFGEERLSEAGRREQEKALRRGQGGRLVWEFNRGLQGWHVAAANGWNPGRVGLPGLSRLRVAFCGSICGGTQRRRKCRPCN